jgi:hypothetical protein
MDSVPKRRCETCIFHLQGKSPCTGICLNRSWQPTGDAQRFVRDRELGCYGGWGVDHWQSKDSDATLGTSTFGSNGLG